MKANVTGVCGECSQCFSRTGFAPAHSVCVFIVDTAQAPGCFAGELSKMGPGLHALPRSKPLRFRFSGTPQRHRLCWACIMPFAGLSSSGNQVLGECTLPRWAVRLITSLVPAAWFPGCRVGVLSQMCCVSPWGADLFGRPSCGMSTIQDRSKTWLATGSLLTVWWRMPSLGPRLPLLTLAVAHLPLCLQRGKGPVCSRLALL